MSEIHELMTELREHAKDDAKRFEAMTDIFADLAADVKEMKGDIKDMHDDLKQVKEQIDPLLNAYNGVVFAKRVITGLAATVVALAAIGGAVIYIIQQAVSKH